MAEIDAKLLQSGGDASDDDEAGDEPNSGNREAMVAAQLNQSQLLARRNMAALNTTRTYSAIKAQRQAQIVQQSMAASAVRNTETVTDSSEEEAEAEDEEARAQALQEQQQQAVAQKRQEADKSQLAGQAMGKLNKAKAVMGALKNAKAMMQEGSAGILKFAWEIMMESFGTAIFIVDLIFILGIIFGKDAICQLGHEWAPKQLKKLKPTEAKAMGERLALVEKAGCCCITGCWGLIIMIIICIIAAVMKFIENPVAAILTLIWESIKTWVCSWTTYLCS